MLRTSLIVVLALGVVACGPRARSGAGPGGMPGPVASYAGLRWVPADATYVVASRRTEDAVLVTRELVDALGVLAEVDASEVGREMARELGGLDLLSTANLTEHGIDVGRGLAIYARGLSPTFAIPLADPARFAAFIDERRGAGAVVQVSRAHDLDVYTFRPDRDVAMHWTFAGDWFLAHLEVTREREPDGAWLDAALAARGAFAGEADLTAALAEGARRLGGEPPVVAVARVPQLLAHPLVEDPPACAASLGKLGRVLAIAGVNGGDARGAIVAELPAGGDGVRALRTPVPAGWAAARAQAPVQLDAGFDLRATAELLGPCLEQDLARDLDVLRDVRSGRAFAHHLDVDRLEGKGAAVVELVDPRLVAEAEDEIPGLSLLRRSRTLGAIKVFDVDLPGMPGFSYALVGSTAIAGVGGTIDAVLAGGMGAPGDELARIELRPQALSVDQWDLMLAPVVERERARGQLIKRLRRWKLGQVTLSIEDRSLVLAAQGQR